MANNGYTIFETFVGAGGSHLGFMQENFKTVYVNDFVKECLDTLIFNNRNILEEGALVDNTPIEQIRPRELREKIKLDKGELDVMFGGVVCKGFSLAGERSPNDERNTLYRKQLDLVNEFRPKISIVENVPGIVNSEIIDESTPNEIREKVDALWKKLEQYKGKKAKLRKEGAISEEFENEGRILREEKKRMVAWLKENNYLISVIEDLEKRYQDMNYIVTKKVLNSAWYGAATKRERVIIVAVREDLGINFNFPDPLYMDEKIFKSGMDLKLLKLPSPKTVNEALATIDYKNSDDVDNIPMNHSEKTVRRFKYIPEGDTIANHIDDLPEDLKISKFYSRGSTMRLNGNEPSPTLVPGHSNFPVHPKEHRSITVREAAAITGFPNDYKFFGTHSKRCEHVGNAVPPALARAIAKECNNLLDAYYNK